MMGDKTVNVGDSKMDHIEAGRMMQQVSYSVYPTTERDGCHPKLLAMVTELYESDKANQTFSLESFRNPCPREFMTLVGIVDGAAVGDSKPHIATMCRYYRAVEYTPHSVPGDIYINAVIVRHDYRGAGYGRALFETLLGPSSRPSASRDNRTRTVCEAQETNYILEVALDNERAIHLYESVGFVEVGRRNLAGQWFVTMRYLGGPVQ